MINLSDKASKKINQLLDEDGLPVDSYLRIFIKKGGCSGLNYKMDFEAPGSEKENDKVFESDGAKVIVDSGSLLYLLGMTLDYEGGLNGQGFVFENPNAKKKCSCGTSFAV